MASVELTAKQQAIIGKWHLYRTENFDDYMKGIGINALMRVIGNRVKPTIEVSHVEEGQVWKVSVKSTFKNENWVIVMDKREKQKTIDGRYFWVTATWDGDTLVETQEVCEDDEKAIPSIIRRFVNDDDELVGECIVGDIVAKRFFKRVA